MEILRLNQLLEGTRHSFVLTYPEFNRSVLRRRLIELERLGVTHLEFGGRNEVQGVRILGKGCVGLVVVAHFSTRRAALKIRRLDADRRSLRSEARMMRAANAVSVGPELYAFSTNFILMELIEARLLADWLQSLEDEDAGARLRAGLRKLIEDCFRLDRAGIDHGQLSHASKHILVSANGNPQIIDFESASQHRRPSNVTSVCQYLFIGSAVARTILRLLGETRRKTLIQGLKAYKANPSFEALMRIEESAGLLAEG